MRSDQMPRPFAPAHSEDVTTPKRNEAVAWRRRYVCPQEGPSLWLPCDERDVPTLREAGCYEIEPLYSQEQIDALQGEVSRLRAFAEHVRTTCFDFVNEGIRPWEHNMRELAWRADEALNLEPPTDGR